MRCIAMKRRLLLAVAVLFAPITAAFSAETAGGGEPAAKRRPPRSKRPATRT